MLLAVTPLMCVPVMLQLPIPLQAIMRSAGTAGANVYDELVALGRVELHTEVDTFPIHDGDDGGTTSSFKTINAPICPLESDTDPTVDGLVFLSTRKQVARSFRQISFKYVKHGGYSRTATFLNGTFKEDDDRVESIIIKCNWKQTGKQTHMADKFIYRCPALHTLIMKDEINGFRSIGTHFLASCPLVKTINLDGFTSITLIESYFMLDCVSIEELDISTMMRHVTNIEGGFMRGCVNLRKLKMGDDDGGGLIAKGSTTTTTTIPTTAACLEDIGNDFLYDCSSLSSLTLPPMGRITMIGNYYLYNCSSLTSVNMVMNVCDDDHEYGLSSLVHIGFGFMNNCSSLTTLSLRGLTSITGVPSYFMLGCTSLQHLQLGGLDSLEVICDNFLAGCSSLPYFDFGMLRMVKRIAPSFMDGCVGLAPSSSSSSTPQRIDLTPLNKVSEIGTRFLGGWLDVNEYEGMLRGSRVLSKGEGGGEEDTVGVSMLSPVLVDAINETKSYYNSI